MTPFEKYLEFDPDALDMLKKCTHIYLDNDVFVCGYKTHSYYITKNNDNKLDKPDTWYVVYATGNVKKLFSIFEPLPYLCYHRDEKDKKIRLLDYEKFRNKYYGQKKEK
tara:strand:+ start:2366 stop:2692 length:327 start_codon:yes stop_codon:yes gene_type:complete